MVPRHMHRLVNEYRMIRMIGIPKEYGRYMHQYTYSMHICWYVCMFLLCLPPPQPPYKGGGLRPPPQRGAAAFGGRPPLWIPLYGGWGGGRHSKNIQTYQQICVEYVYWCIYLPYSLGIPIIPIILYSVTSLPGPLPQKRITNRVCNSRINTDAPHF